MDMKEEAKEIFEEIKMQIERDEPEYNIINDLTTMLNKLENAYRRENVDVNVDDFVRIEIEYFEGCNVPMEQREEQLREHADHFCDDVSEELYDMAFERLRDLGEI